MSERLLRWRAAWMVAVAILFGFWWAFAGGPSFVIQIQFGTAPEVLEGAEVVIDGEVAGVLSRMGSRTVSGFRVDAGEHTVEVRLEGHGSRPMTVNPQAEGGTALLMADFSEMRDENGGFTPTVVLY